MYGALESVAVLWRLRSYRDIIIIIIIIIIITQKLHLFRQSYPDILLWLVAPGGP